MACDKPYGLRRVFIAPEEDGGTGSFYELRVNNVELPKIFAEQVVIDESTGIRGDTAFVSGNLNELTGTITVTLSNNTYGFSRFAPIQTLFKGAGFMIDSNHIVPQNSGSCGNTFCIYTIDRTGLLAERLEGCIVTTVDFTFNRSDAPTVSFAFQAAKKYEFWGSGADQANLHNDSETVNIARGSTIAVNTGLDKNATFAAGVLPVVISDSSDGEEFAYISAINGSNITITRPEAIEHTGDVVTVKPFTPPGAAPADSSFVGAYATNRSWNVQKASSDISDLKIQAASLSIETGMSYGELLAGHDYLSEVLVGGLNITGSFTVYVDVPSAAAYLTKINTMQTSVYSINIGSSWSIAMPHLVFSESPDLALAKNEPASGDFAFKLFNGEVNGTLAFDMIDIG